MRFKQKILGLIISQQEREELSSGAVRIIKREIKPQPTDHWMENVIMNFPDLKMFDPKLQQRFWLSNPNAGVDKKGRDTYEIKPKYTPGMITPNSVLSYIVN